jgi:hypothetical protein
MPETERTPSTNTPAIPPPAAYPTQSTGPAAVPPPKPNLQISTEPGAAELTSTVSTAIKKGNFNDAFNALKTTSEENRLFVVNRLIEDSEVPLAKRISFFDQLNKKPDSEWGGSPLMSGARAAILSFFIQNDSEYQATIGTLPRDLIVKSLLDPGGQSATKDAAAAVLEAMAPVGGQKRAVADLFAMLKESIESDSPEKRSSFKGYEARIMKAACLAGLTGAPDFLIGVAESNGEISLRVAAVSALSHFARELPAVHSSIAGILDRPDEDPRLRHVAALVLLGSSNPAVDQIFGRILNSFKPDATPISSLPKDDPKTELRLAQDLLMAAAIQHLEHTEGLEKHKDLLTRIIKENGRSYARGDAKTALAILGDKPMIEEFFEIIKKEPNNIATFDRVVLLQKDPATKQALIERVFSTDELAPLWGKIAIDLKPEEIVAHKQVLLKAADNSGSLAIYQRLSESHVPEAVPLMIAQLGSPTLNVNVRLNFCSYLAEIGNEKCAEYLFGVLSGKNGGFTPEEETAVKKLFVSMIKKNPGLRDAAIFDGKTLDSSLAEYVEKIASAAKPNVQAGSGVGVVGDLLESLRSEQNLQALRRIGALESPSFRWHGLVRLVRNGDQAAVAELGKLSVSGNQDTIKEHFSAFVNNGSDGAFDILATQLLATSLDYGLNQLVRVAIDSATSPAQDGSNQTIPKLQAALGRLAAATEDNDTKKMFTDYKDALSECSKLGVSTPLRFPPELLSELVKERLNQTPDSKPVAVIVAGSDDDKHALHALGIYVSSLIDAGMRVRYYEVDTERAVDGDKRLGMVEAIKDGVFTGSPKFKPAELITLVGHGNTAGTQFGKVRAFGGKEIPRESFFFDPSDREELSKDPEVKAALANGGQLVFISCATGEGVGEKQSVVNNGQTARAIWPQAKKGQIIAPMRNIVVLPPKFKAGTTEIEQIWGEGVDGRY